LHRALALDVLVDRLSDTNRNMFVLVCHFLSLLSRWCRSPGIASVFVSTVMQVRAVSASAFHLIFAINSPD